MQAQQQEAVDQGAILLQGKTFAVNRPAAEAILNKGRRKERRGGKAPPNPMFVSRRWMRAHALR